MPKDIECGCAPSPPEPSSKSGRQPQSIRAILLVGPFVFTSIHTVLISEFFRNGISALFFDQGPTASTDVTKHFAWVITCWSLAGAALFTSEWAICQLCYRSWTYVRAYLLVIIPLLVGSMTGFLGSGASWTDICGSTMRSSRLDWSKTACMSNWVIIGIVWLMVLLGDELEGRLGYVTGPRTGERTSPWSNDIARV